MNAKKGIVDIPVIVPVDLPILSETVYIDPNWIAGFTSGEGCFTVSIKKSKGTPRYDFFHEIYINSTFP